MKVIYFLSYSIRLIMIFETEGMKEMAERYYPFLHSLAWTYFPTNNSTEGREKSILTKPTDVIFQEIPMLRTTSKKFCVILISLERRSA